MTMSKRYLRLGHFILVVFLSLHIWTATTGKPGTPQEEKNFCDRQFDLCVKECENLPDEEMTYQSCILECEEEANDCYALP